MLHEFQKYASHKSVVILLHFDGTSSAGSIPGISYKYYERIKTCCPYFVVQLCCTWNTHKMDICGFGDPQYAYNINLTTKE